MSHGRKFGTLGTKRAAYTLKVCARALMHGDELMPQDMAVLARMKRDIARFKGGVFASDATWLWIRRIARDLGMEEYDGE